MDVVALLLTAAETTARSPNLWGALGCAVAYSASLFATLDALADLMLARGTAPTSTLPPAVGLKFGSKIAAAVITVVAAGLVLALDANWFAFWMLTIAFAVAVGVGILVMRRHGRVQRPRTDTERADRGSGAP